jgi:hypothetical protein
VSDRASLQGATADASPAVARQVKAFIESDEDELQRGVCLKACKGRAVCSSV